MPVFDVCRKIGGGANEEFRLDPLDALAYNRNQEAFMFEALTEKLNGVFQRL